MGTIEKRGTNSWRVGVKVNTPTGWQWIRETIHLDAKLTEKQQRKAAEKALARLAEEVGAGERSAGKQGYTVASWAEVWMEQHVKPNCTPVTYGDYRFLLDSRILPLLGDVPLTRLTPMMLTEWLNQVRQSPRMNTRKADEELSHKRPPSQKLATASQQRKPLSAKTVLHYYTCMEAMLSVAVQLEVLDRNPMDRVKRPKVKKTKVKVLTEGRALELLRCLADEPNMCYMNGGTTSPCSMIPRSPGAPQSVKP